MDSPGPWSFYYKLRATDPDPLFGTDLAEKIGDGATEFIKTVFHLKIIGKPPAHWEKVARGAGSLRQVVSDFNPSYSVAPAILGTPPPEPPPLLQAVDKTLECCLYVQYAALTYAEALEQRFGWRWKWDRQTAIEVGKGSSARMLERHILELLTDHEPDYELTRSDCRRSVAPVMASLFGTPWRDESSGGILAQKLKDIHRARSKG